MKFITQKRQSYKLEIKEKKDEYSRKIEDYVKTYGRDLIQGSGKTSREIDILAETQNIRKCQLCLQIGIGGWSINNVLERTVCVVLEI